MLKDYAETTPPLDRFRIQLRALFKVLSRLSEYCLRGQQSVLRTSRMYLDIGHQLFSEIKLPSSHTDSDQIGKWLCPVEGWRLTRPGGEVFDTSDCRVKVALGLLDYPSNGKYPSEDLEITDSARARKAFVN